MGWRKQDRQTQKLFDNVTKSLLQQTEAQDRATSSYPYEDIPLKEEHPIGSLLLLRGAGPAAAKGLEFIGEKMMPSAFLKGVGQTFPKVAKATTAISPYADAGLLATWGAQGIQEAKEAAKSGDAAGAIAGASMAALPLMGINPETARELTTAQKANKVAGALNKEVKLVSRPISEAEKLGIPKGERSNPKALEDPQYWGYKQWNDRYNAAVESGNWDEVQRLRDLHFKNKTLNNRIVDYMGNPHKVYHGSPEDWYIFDDSKRGVDDVIYFSTDKAYADQYTVPRNKWQKGMVPTRNSREFYLYGKEPINVGSDMYYGSVQDELIHNWANGLNADSVYGLDAITSPLNPSSGIEFGVLRRNQFKLTDPITKTKTGEIVPIVKRDNFRNPDIRYKQGGILKAQKGTPNNGLPPWIKRDDSTRTYITAFKPGDKDGRSLLRNWQWGEGKQLIRDSSLVKRIGNDGRYIYIPRSLAGGMSGGFHISEITGEDKDSDEFMGRLQFVGMTEDGWYEYYDPLTGQNELYDIQFENGGKIHIKAKW